MLKLYIIVSCLLCVLALQKNESSTAENGADQDFFDTHQAIINHGYPAETHRVTTHDGYILEVIRIPYGKNQTEANVARPVVFMMHGLLAAASSFIAMGPEHGIAYHLVEAGFDLWMGNARGNYYSRHHVTLDPDHPEEKFDFFDFSFEEIGMYDVAAMIDYVLEQTNKEDLHYIGHSQGGTVFLILSTMRPEYNKKIKGAHLLAAVGYQDYFPNTLLTTLANRVDLIYGMALLLGVVEYFPIDIPWEQRRLGDPDYCFGDIKYKSMCDLVGAREIMSEDLQTGNLLAGASLKQIAHYGQNIRDKLFRRWHYGADKNIEVYGTSEPPLYDFNLITTFVTMHYSLSDNLLDERDVLAMANDISRGKVHKVARESFLHEEYISAIDAKELVTDFLIEDILKLEAGNFVDWGVEPELEIDTDNVDENDIGGDPNSNSSSGIICSTIVKMFLIFNSLYVYLRA